MNFLSASATNKPVSDVTRILDRAQAGDLKAAEELLPLVYEELRRLAAAKLARESPGQTLQPTALVHEACRKGKQNQRSEPEPRSASSCHIILLAPPLDTCYLLSMIDSRE